MVSRSWYWLLLLSACSPGVGSDPKYPDAQFAEDAAVLDTHQGFKDAAPSDAGMGDVYVTDYGPPPSYPFTGVYDINGVGQQIFAREVDGTLNLIVGGFPTTYVGTISEGGVVDVESPEMLASGCLVARITGLYGRSDAMFTLDQETCNSQMQPISDQLIGAFNTDFDGERSGVYELQAEIVHNVQCFGGVATGHTVKYGISFVPGTRHVAIFTGVDIIPNAAVYFGQGSFQDWQFAASQRLDLSGSTAFAFSGFFQAITAAEPVHFFGERDVYYPDSPIGSPCTFRMHLQGDRVAAP